MNLIKSKKRVADHGEVFTPPWMVEAMLNLVKDETERIDSRFLEPACGSGNFLLRVLQRKAKLEYAAALEHMNEDLAVLSEKEVEFLPITTKAYLYLSGTPFKALATGEFIEEQIFNWTYTDEQRAKEEFAAKNPGKWNPYGALPQMRLLTYQMPDELLAVASAGEFDEFDLNEFFAATGTGERRAVQAQERRTKMARYYPGPVHAEGCRGPQDGFAAAVPLFGCAAAAVLAALVLVSAERRGLSRDGEPVG